MISEEPALPINPFRTYWLGLVSPALSFVIFISLHYQLVKYCGNPAYQEGLVLGKAIFPAIIIFFLSRRLKEKWRKSNYEYFSFCFFICFFFFSCRELYSLEKERYHFANFDSEIPNVVRRQLNLSSGTEPFLGFPKEKFGPYTEALYIYNSWMDFLFKSSNEIIYANTLLCEVVESISNTWNYQSNTEPKSLLISGQDTMNTYLCTFSNIKSSLLKKVNELNINKLETKIFLKNFFSNCINT